MTRRVVGKLKTRRDANENEIVQALEMVGAKVIRFDSPADLCVGYRREWRWMEVKDGSKALSKQELTKSEREFQELCHRDGLHYHVVKSIDEALRAIGVKV